ncbi:MAG: 4Fe-4S dicluster domain-containing protein [Phycisphaerae bacterium]
MVQKMYFCDEASLVRLLESLDAADVYAVVRRERGPEYCNLRKTEGAELALREPRPSASPKSFLLPVKERVAAYDSEGVHEEGSRPTCGRRALVGLRSCDLQAIKYLDKVFREGDFRDPFYEARRAADVLITVDCVAVHENCFCTALGGKPYAESGFDLNITPVSKGYLLEVGSDKGQAIVDKAKDLVREATGEEIDERRRLREKACEDLDRQNEGLRLPDKLQEILLSKQESDEWTKHASKCVECAACTFVCPTCHCFYLHDQVLGPDEFERVRTWDSCLLGDYSRMAGPAGAKPTPRPRLQSRFVNRFLHKYAFSPEQYGMLGCTGCGRCIEACFGKIDIREVLKELSGVKSG